MGVGGRLGGKGERRGGRAEINVEDTEVRPDALGRGTRPGGAVSQRGAERSASGKGPWACGRVWWALKWRAWSGKELGMRVRGACLEHLRGALVER